MYRKVLVPLDGSSFSEQILPYARFAAESLKIPVELLGVVDIAALATSLSAEGARYLNNLVLEGVRRSDEYLKGIARTFSGVSVKCSVEKGKPEEVIVEKAASDKGTLIAMATHGRSGMSRWLLGSVAEKVLRSTTNPLLLVRAGEGGTAEAKVKIESIIVPLDTSSLAESVLPDVIDLAKALNLHVVITYAFAIPLSAYYGAGDHYSSDYGKLLAQLRDHARNYLEEKVMELKQQGLEKVSSVLLEGSAAEEIIALVRGQSYSILAMCTHGRSGIKRWVLGSVTEKVVRHSGDPVLVIRAV
jgi:nucleotide-binding universal stress UspA family protein